MEKIALNIETIKELREALVAAQTGLRESQVQKTAAVEVKAENKAKISLLSKKAGEVLAKAGYLKPELVEGWTARVATPDGHALALEALEKIATVQPTQPETKPLGRPYKGEKQASADSKSEEANKKFLTKCGFTV